MQDPRITHLLSQVHAWVSQLLDPDPPQALFPRDAPSFHGPPPHSFAGDVLLPPQRSLVSNPLTLFLISSGLRFIVHLLRADNSADTGHLHAITAYLNGMPLSMLES